MKKPVTYLPDPQLQNYIVEYGVIHTEIGDRESFFSPPLGLSGFIIQTINSTGNIDIRIRDQQFISVDAVASGQVTSPVYGVFADEVKSFLVFFHPLGMYQLFGTDMATLTDKSIPLRTFLGRDLSNDLMIELKSDQNTSRQIQVLNNFFSSIIPVGQNSSQLQLVLDFIQLQKGCVTISELEKIGYFHRRTLERHFRKMVGLSPKEYARIYQFKCMITLIQDQEGITWSQLAEQAGYYDLSHLSRYVNDYLQVSPSSLVNLDLELILYLLDK